MNEYKRIFLSLLSVWVNISSCAWASTHIGQISILKRFVVMDGACAWPVLTVLPNGDLAALIWPYPNHGHHEGAAESWVSSDHGLTWAKAGVPVMNIPGVARLNVAGGMAADGNYIAVVSGWAEKPTIANVTSYMPPKVRLNAEGVVVARSADFGHTWVAQPEQVFQQADGKNVIPYGRVTSIAGLTLGVMCYMDDVLFYTSDDNGISWRERGIVSTGRVHNETTWLRLQNGELYAAARRWDDGGIDGLRSSDNGLTWRLEERLTLPRQHPADMIHLPDGRLLLSYSSRNEGSWGIWVRFGDAMARNWGPPILLADLGEAHDGETGLMGRDGGYPSTVIARDGSLVTRFNEHVAQDRHGMGRDGGYPSTVIARDGSLVTAFYSKGNAHHQRYHVGIVKWRIAKPPEKGTTRDAN